MEGREGEGSSLALTPSWAVAIVVTIMVAFGFFFSSSLDRFGEWLERTKRKSLSAALNKIKEELMLFGVLSLLMGHWIVFVAKICVKSSALSDRFYPCASKADFRSGKESFASYESLEQLHRFVFVLGITHVSYSFAAIALAMIKIYSWRTWENQAKAMIFDDSEGDPKNHPNKKVRRLKTFILSRTAHPWSQHGVLVWLLCFIRQFWSSINRSDYMALRLGFITTHELPLTYDFLNYMLRSVEEEFRDIVGIRIPLWIYAIFCIFLNFHGTNAYFWLSFLPAILILLIGTKLHRVVVKLAVEVMENCPWMENHHFHLRDDLFWFGKPIFFLRLIQLISFQFCNVFQWEIKESSCFMENRSFVVIRLTFGVVCQFWCSFITFPLYVIVTQMGSRFKKSVVSENVRDSIQEWQSRARARKSTSSTSSSSSTAALLNKHSTTSTVVDALYNMKG
ncbi:hypothetical protein QQ045_020188 [Rhodiola kirilowii]